MLRAGLLLALASAVLGQPLIQPRIIDGTTPAVGAFPAQVALTYGDKYLCGGTLVDDQHVLTSAECVKKAEKATDLKVTGGVVDLDKKEPAPKTRFVMKAYWFTENLNYDKVKTEEGIEVTFPIDDIVLIRLNDKFDISSEIAPIRWATEEVTNKTVTCKVSGWGAQNENGSPSTKLLALDAHLKAVSSCSEALQYVPNGNITDAKHLCIQSVGRKRALCKGDEGSGIICGDRLQGIVSWGKDCVTAYALGVNIVNYKQWIEESIAKSNAEFPTSTSTTTTTTSKTPTGSTPSKPPGGSTAKPSGASTHSAPVIALLGLLSIWRLL